MGLANSKIFASQIGIPDTHNCRPSSPSTSSSSVKLLDTDPRSPSEEIVRTPIMVDGNAPKESTNWELDPRSPSALFERTPRPLNSNTKSIQDPRSPTERIPRTPLENIEECFFPDDLKEEPATPSTERKTELSFKVLDETPKEEGFQPKRLFWFDSQPGQRVPLRSANRPSSLRLRAIQQHTSLKQATVAPTTCDPAAECTTNAWSLDKENSPASSTLVI